MADDWQVGDLALCVRRAPERGRFLFGEPNPGEAYEVLNVSLEEFADDTIDIALTLRGAPPCTNEFNEPTGPTWWHGRFIKITPTEADEFDREVIELLRREPVPSMKERIV